MTRARDIANLVDANGDIVAGALDNVPASNDASALTTGTLDAARLPTEILSSDTTPQLGGNLDLNSSNITGTGNINTTGTATFSGLATANNANLTAEGGSATVDVRQGSAKVWSNINGAFNSVRDSYNLSSMTDLGAGQPQANFSNNMNNSNYAVPFNTGGHNGVNRMDAMRGLENGSFTTSKCSFYTGAESNLQYYDSQNVHSAVFGDLA